MQPSVFAIGFSITYWNLLHKELSNWLLVVKQSGLRQKAVKAFFRVCGNTMLDVGIGKVFTQKNL
jgi:hypothetical protein